MISPPDARAGGRAPVRLSTPTDWAVALAAGLLPVAYLDAFWVPSWTPRTAIVLLLVPLGAVELVRGARRRDLASVSAVLLLSALAVSTIAAGVPWWNLRGGFGRDSGLIFLGGLLTTWAAARRTTPRARRTIATISIAAVAASVVVGLVQIAIQPDGGIWQMIGDRPSGLHVNPVYLGAVCAAATVLLLRYSSPRRTDVLVVTGIGVFAAMTVLSGSRGALGGLLVAVGLTVLDRARRSHRAPFAALAGGLAAGWALGASTSTTGVTERLDRGGDGRGEVWRFALDAFAERPLIGHGLGQFRAAIQSHFDADFVRDHALDVVRRAWPDAHNVVLQIAVVGGVVALVTTAGFVVGVARTARGPLAWGAALIAATWLLQPITLPTGPLAFLWLGLASTGRTPDRPASDRRSSITTKVLLVCGAVLMTSLLVLDQRLRVASDADAAATFADLAEIAPDDPVLAATTARLWSGAGELDESVEWTRRAVALAPWDAVLRAQYATRLFDQGDPIAAVIEIRRALDDDPWNSFALRTALAIGSQLGRSDLQSLAVDRLCRLDAAGEELCGSS